MVRSTTAIALRSPTALVWCATPLIESASANSPPESVVNKVTLPPLLGPSPMISFIARVTSSLPFDSRGFVYAILLYTSLTSNP